MKTVLITGASSGIGLAYAHEFARRGYELILTARRENVLQQVAQELEKQYGCRCHVIPMDLSEEHAAKNLCHEITKDELQVDVLVNNAGFATKGLLEQSDYEKQHREVNLNVLALTELTHLLIGPMAKRHDGLVINVASVSGFNPIAYNAVYAATKAYVLSFSQSIGYEYADKGVQVIAVCPQATDTHFFDDFDKMSDKMRSPEDVVRTTFRGIKRKKAVVADGFLAQCQAWMPRVLSRKMRVRITGHIGKSIWGKDDK